ncbi:MAG: hypothetical protein INR65_15380 [Gluconacetobacter diazotrophicus]|nr:hypothetical protein [Gluconacetobacter diazotrophicus]
MDTQALHDDVAANHPGPVNAADPGFEQRNDAGLALALRRANVVTDEAGYLFTMWGYVAGFDDGHVQLRPGGRRDTGMPGSGVRWPGFLTGFDAVGRQVVLSRAADAPVPLGAVLEECDGTGAAALAAARVGAFRGRWFLDSQRHRFGGLLLVDDGDPFAPVPRRCRFSMDGRNREVALRWRPIGAAELARRLDDVDPQVKPPIGARVFPDGTRWFFLSDFDGDPKGSTARSLEPLIAAMRRDRDAIGRAPRIVLDLRGNHGGSSDWGDQIATVLWGEQARKAAEPGVTEIDWRVSAANLARLKAYQRDLAAAGNPEPGLARAMDISVGGMEAARAAGRTLWHAPDEGAAAAQAPVATGRDPAAGLRGTVFVLTDRGCGSACLDAVDLWRALGAVQVGQETSADTLYMDTRTVALPSGAAEVTVPMKVFRGRARGSNVPWVPVRRFDGDMRDDAAIERWIAGLK